MSKKYVIHSRQHRRFSALQSLIEFPTLVLRVISFVVGSHCFACHFMFLHLRSIFTDIRNHLGEKTSHIDRLLCIFGLRVVASLIRLSSSFCLLSRAFNTLHGLLQLHSFWSLRLTEIPYQAPTGSPFLYNQCGTLRVLKQILKLASSLNTGAGLGDPTRLKEMIDTCKISLDLIKAWVFIFVYVRLINNQ